MLLHRCTAADLPARMNEIQWQAMWRYYVLPGHLKRADAGFEAGASSGDWVLDACHIAVEDGRDAGFCWAALRGDEAWCGGFGVRPEFRQRGLGGALLRATAAALREHGARVWRLEVVQQNTAAVTAYLRAGFRQVADLALLRGHATAPLAPGESIVDGDASACLDRYATWPQVRRTWGVAPGCLRRHAPTLAAKLLQRDGETVAFLLHQGGSVWDVGLAPNGPTDAGAKLIATLPGFSWGNVPDTDPTRAAVEAAPGVECWVRQWEMEWPLY